eukprot:CAMPEP_0119136442 /NCGR_PEP_ID=MMETSP1310-20130426/21437_1 /TAXON_ID=464262 /ORGANISM="Genus nov. species nov., Strain RCC2339" /LENGTH=477 /DNA_ID=CAMNT_0007127429 /DNA_START=63 /DNA_END=1493 /DNA_ORIENTATION=+
MLVLFESPAGYGLFKVLDEGKLKEPENLWKEIGEAGKAQEILSLLAFKKFDGTVDALEAATAAVEGKVGKGLKKFLKSAVKKYDLKDDVLGVVDTKLGGEISKKLKIKVIHDEAVDELTRAIRQHTTLLVDGLEQEDLNAMTLGLAHSLSRYKLKFSPDKVDTMIVQAIGLLDDLDKELNNYVMRVREWYGWHFPELGKIVTDNMMFVRLVKHVGVSSNFRTADLTPYIPEELVEDVKEAALISMGSDIADGDLSNIHELCSQVEGLTEYRETLFTYLRNRMNAIAPNLSVLVGELVGARLIAHAGSLMNLAKHPASTVQILGAEKALFRALKVKHDTPKYGLIYHASVVGQASNKNKGKISRMLANKTALSVRVDALGETDGPSIGVDLKAVLESNLRALESGTQHRLSGRARTHSAPKKFEPSYSSSSVYNPAADFTMTEAPAAGEAEKKKKKKKKTEEEEEEKEEEEEEEEEEE